MSDYVDVGAWLTEQLDIDQQRAEAWEHDNPDDGGYYSCPAVHTEPYGDLPWGEENCDCGLAARRGFTLADIAAKRRIIELSHDYGSEILLDRVVQELATAYADRPGYREHWGWTSS